MSFCCRLTTPAWLRTVTWLGTTMTSRTAGTQWLVLSSFMVAMREDSQKWLDPDIGMIRDEVTKWIHNHNMVGVWQQLWSSGELYQMWQIWLWRDWVYANNQESLLSDWTRIWNDPGEVTWNLHWYYTESNGIYYYEKDPYWCDWNSCQQKSETLSR